MRREINQTELSFIYQKIGEAIWHLQHVEDLLINFHFIKFHAIEPNGIAEEEANMVLKNLQMLPLGKLIGIAEDKKTISTEFADSLREFNKKRIWVVHHSMRDNGEDLYTTKGLRDFIKNICEFTDNALILQREIESQVLDHSDKHGFSREKAYEMANNYLNNLKGLS